MREEKSELRRFSSAWGGKRPSSAGSCMKKKGKEIFSPDVFILKNGGF